MVGSEHSLKPDEFILSDEQVRQIGGLNKHALAQRLRKNSPAPRSDMPIGTALTAVAIYALADALDDLADER